MPNQYTKFKASAQNLDAREFRWREWNTGKRPKRSSGAQKKHSSKSVSPATSNEGPGEADRHARLAGSALVQYLPSGGLRIDPFRAYPVAPNRSELAVLDHFFHVLAPSGKQNQNAPVLRKRHTAHIDPHINLLLPYVMQEAPLFDALLASCQASIALSSGLSAYNDNFFMMHRGRAMAGLSKQLENSIDVSAMLAVAMLITCDWLTGDIKAVAGHAQALQRMKRLRGKLPEATPWDRFVKAGVDAYSSIGYLATGITSDNDRSRHTLDYEVDPFKELEYPQPPFSTEQCDEWSHLPTGFSELILASQVSTQLIAIIIAINETKPSNKRDFLGALILVQPIQAALQRFSQHKNATYLERCLAAGLLAYSFQYPCIQTPNMFHDPPMNGFIRLFSVSYRAQSTNERDLLMWAHMTIESVLANRSSRLPGSVQVFAKALKTYNLMNDWKRLSPVLQRFFCTPELLERWQAFHAEHKAAVTLKSLESTSTSPTQQSTPYSSSLTSSPPQVCPVSGLSSDTVVGGCPFRPHDDNRSPVPHSRSSELGYLL